METEAEADILEFSDAEYVCQFSCKCNAVTGRMHSQKKDKKKKSGGFQSMGTAAGCE